MRCEPLGWAEGAPGQLLVAELRAATGWGITGLGFPWRPLYTVSLDRMEWGAQEVGGRSSGTPAPRRKSGNALSLPWSHGAPPAPSVHHVLCKGFGRAPKSPLGVPCRGPRDPPSTVPATTLLSTFTVNITGRRHQATGRMGGARAQGCGHSPSVGKPHGASEP